MYSNADTRGAVCRDENNILMLFDKGVNEIMSHSKITNMKF